MDLLIIAVRVLYTRLVLKYSATTAMIYVGTCQCIQTLISMLAVC